MAVVGGQHNCTMSHISKTSITPKAHTRRESYAQETTNTLPQAFCVVQDVFGFAGDFLTAISPLAFQPLSGCQL